MKNLHSAILLSLLLLILSCEDSNLERKPDTALSGKTTSAIGARIADYSFDGTGELPIPLDLAKRWIANHGDKNTSGNKIHFAGRDMLLKILNRDGSIGVRIYYAIDDNGKANVLLVGVDGKGNDLLPKIVVRAKASVDNLTSARSETFEGTEGETMQEDVMKSWVKKFNEQNPNAVQAHFFGFEILRQILSQAGCKGIRMYRALNDAGVPQLLLVGATKNGANLLPSSIDGGRTADDGDAIIADISYPCPAYCSGN